MKSLISHLKDKIPNDYSFIKCFEENNLNNYSIFFTPRSGSTYLAETIRRTNLLGNPHEWLNENQFEQGYLKVSSIDKYLKLCYDESKTKNNIFGIKITLDQLNSYSDYMTSEQFFSCFDKFFYLRRKDIILQGISLFKAAKLNIFHNFNSARVREGYDQIEYDRKSIKDFIIKIWNLEKETENLFTKNNIEPVCFFYNDIVKDVESVVNLIASQMKINNNIHHINMEGNIEKLPTGKTLEFYERFTKEESEFCYDCINRLS